MSTNADRFYDSLRRVKAARSGSAEDQAQGREEWLDALKTLFQTLEGWLQPGTKEALLQIKSGTIELNEDSLGTYSAPTLKIELPGQKQVRLEPIGVEILGGYTGRVDLISGPCRAFLLRDAQNHWTLAHPTGYRNSMITSATLPSEQVQLTEDAFLGWLAEFAV